MPTVQTTTLLVSRPSDFSELEAHFQLVRYVLPATLHSRSQDKRNTSSRTNIYAQLHNSLRTQFDYPYKTFMHDKLDGPRKWVVYVLVPREGSQVKAIKLGFLAGAPLPPQLIPFHKIEFHVLLKLLQIAYFRGTVPGYFIGQDYCYAYAKRSEKLDCDICVQVQLQGDTRTRSDDPLQEFKVIGGAHPFRRLMNNPEKRPDTYFGRRIRDNKAYYIHLRVDRAQEYIESGKAVYAISPIKGRHTTLPYHDLQSIEHSTGKIIYDFIKGFTQYLAQYSITGRTKERNFLPFTKVPEKSSGLPLHLLETIYIYDNRLQSLPQFAPIPSVSLQAYIDLITRLLAQLQPDLQFAPITNVSQANGHPVLVLQDHEEEDFQENGLFSGQPDPYEQFYTAFPHLPKQSFNVNFHSADEKGTLSPPEYLNYSLPADEDENFVNKLQMALYQLYLKDVIINERSVHERLPFYPTPYVFLRKRRGGEQSHEILLHLEKDRLHFVDLRSPEGKDDRTRFLANIGVNWGEMEERMLIKYYKLKEDGTSEELPRYDAIVAPNIFVELEGLNERILYDYEEVLKRRSELDKPLVVEEFKLAPYYDKIKNAPFPPLAQLHLIKNNERYSQGLLTKQEREAFKFYQQLEAYDALLKEIEYMQPMISYKDLINGWMQRIAPILEITSDDDQHYRTGRLRRLYKKREMFLSEKANELYLYEGIWYDTDDSYMIGSTYGIERAQERAHLIRHFDVYQGKERFDIAPLLTAMSIQFVRLRQFTVYPYPFHLINLYNEITFKKQSEASLLSEEPEE